MLIAYILFCFIALFMAYRRHRREKRIQQLEDHWERYYEYQHTQGDTFHQGKTDLLSRHPYRSFKLITCEISNV